MSQELSRSSSPHIHDDHLTRKDMLHVLIACIPALIAAVILFGLKSLQVVGLCVLFCVLTEMLYCLLLRRPVYTGDLSAAVTGVLLGMNLPVSVSLYACLIGSVAAILVAKQLFGGIGQNFVNPALFGRAVMLLCFPKEMTAWSGGNSFVGLKSSATPLQILSESSNLSDLPSVKELFFGFRCGCIGETCILAIIFGGLYLIFAKVISPIIPLTFLGSAAVLTCFLSPAPLRELMSGGLFFGAVFMATDYTTSPTSGWGKAVFGIGCGILTVIIRHFASSAEGVSYAILFMNLTVPYIERYIRPKPFGIGTKAVKTL